jgi:shikimate dehydrogenase
VVRSSPDWPTAASRVVATIGYPVAHSLSPLLHLAAFEALGLDWVSVGFPVAPGDLGPALEGARALGIAGLSVTMPHKAEAASLVDELTPIARRLGAVNCVINRDQRLVGDSTDGFGLLEALRRGAGVDPAGLRCAVIGAGGAARAAIAALADAGAGEVVVVNRTRSRAEQAAALAGSAGRTGGPEEIASAEVVIHATPYGMLGNEAGPESSPLSGGGFKAGQVVMDLIYVPAETPVLRLAAQSGAVTVGGIGMLVHQAALAVELWTGSPAPVEAMWEAAHRVVSD